MILLAMVAFLVGVALGRRFTVMILVPGTVILLVLAAKTGITHADTAWSILLTTAIAATSMQIGYLAGIGIRDVRLARSVRRSQPMVSPGNGS